MENKVLEISPKKAEVLELINQCKDIKINDVDDKIGYQSTNDAIKKIIATEKEIKVARKEISDYYRDKHLQLVALEKELLEMLEPVKKGLKEQKQLIDGEVLKKKMAASLPLRKNALKEINLEVEDEKLLSMTDAQFEKFFLEKKEEYLIKKEEEIKAKEEKAKRDKEIEEAKEEARKKAIEQAEIDKQKAIEEEKARSEKEKQDLLDAQKAKEEKAEADRLARIAEEKAEAEKLRQDKIYQEFLAKNGYTKENQNEFKVFKTDKTITLYKKIDQITLS